MEPLRLNKIEDAIEDFKSGKFVIVVDDEDRENEGDLIIAAEMITAEKVNFMLKYARGVLCAPITIERCKELELPHQVEDNTSVLGTPFTVTVDKLCPRPSGDHQGACRSQLHTTDLWTAWSREPPLRSGQWCAATQRPYGSSHRPVPHGRSLSGRRADGDHE